MIMVLHLISRFYNRSIIIYSEKNWLFVLYLYSLHPYSGLLNTLDLLKFYRDLVWGSIRTKLGWFRQKIISRKEKTGVLCIIYKN